MLLTVKSVVSTVAGFPRAASCAFACAARNSCAADVKVPTDASWPSPWGSCHGGVGYSRATGNLADETSTPTATSCQCGAVPRAPRLVGVPRPWDQYQNGHS